MSPRRIQARPPVRGLRIRDDDLEPHTSLRNRPAAVIDSRHMAGIHHCYRRHPGAAGSGPATTALAAQRLIPAYGPGGFPLVADNKSPLVSSGIYLLITSAVCMGCAPATAGV